MAPPHVRSPAPRDSGNRARNTDQAGNQIKASHKPNAPRGQDFLVTVDKTALARVQIALKTWRGEHRISIQEATAIIAGTYFPAGTPVNIPLDRLGEFIEALQATEREARARGLIGGAR